MTGERGSARTWVGLVVGVVLVVAYLLAFRSLWNQVSLPDVAWARRAQLLSALEALSFAAAGALLGTTVSRGATVQAEKVADRERERAESYAADARSATAMRAALQAKKSTVRPDRFAGLAAGDESRDVAAALIDEVLAVGESARHGS